MNATARMPGEPARRAAQATNPVNVVDVAQLLVNSRRAAIDMSVEQIRELAAAVLIFDQQLDDANRRMASMMIAEFSDPQVDQAPAKVQVETVVKNEIIHVPLVTGGDAALSSALEELAKARWHLDQERHSSGENLARQKFERAAIAVCNHVTPRKRT